MVILVPCTFYSVVTLLNSRASRVDFFLCLEESLFTASTPINISHLEAELQRYPDRSFVHYLLSGLRSGFHTGIKEVPTSTHEGNNLRTARQFPDIVTKLLQEEVDQGFLIGPFDKSPFTVCRISPLGVVFGKYSSKPRLILDLSWPHDDDEISSINDLIDKDECSLTYSTIDQAIHNIVLAGRHSFLCKCDIASAFKLLPIRPSLVPYYGCRWNNQFYFFVRLPFGGRSSPRIFDCFSHALEWILRNNYHIHYCQHLLDDFLTIDSTEEEGLRTMAILTTIFKRLCVPLSASKTIGPVTSLTYLGILLDTSAFETRIPAEKIDRMLEFIIRISTKTRCTKRELLQLIGHFNFASRVIVPGRSFLSFLFQLAYTVKDLHLHVRIGREARIDLSMWHEFLTHWNGRSLFLESALTTNTHLQLYTDAAGSEGYGGIFGSKWFTGLWTSEFLRLIKHTRGSTLLELVPIVSSAVVWGSHWIGKRIVFYCDNQALVYILNKRRSPDTTIMLFLRRLTLLSLQYNFHMTAIHIAGATNEIADALSRQQWSRFRRLAPWADFYPCDTPPLSMLIYPLNLL